MSLFKWNEILVAAFKAGTRHSLKYQSYKTEQGFQKALFMILDSPADYISIRIIRKKEGSP